MIIWQDERNARDYRRTLFSGALQRDLLKKFLNENPRRNGGFLLIANSDHNTGRRRHCHQQKHYQQHEKQPGQDGICFRETLGSVSEFPNESDGHSYDRENQCRNQETRHLLLYAGQFFRLAKEVHKHRENNRDRGKTEVAPEPPLRL